MTAENYLYKRVKERQEELNISARDLERRAGLGQGWVKDLRSNPKRSPRVETLQKVAQALGVRFLWLTEGRGPKEELPESEKARCIKAAENMMDLPEDEREAWFDILDKTSRRKVS